VRGAWRVTLLLIRHPEHGMYLQVQSAMWICRSRRAPASPRASASWNMLIPRCAIMGGSVNRQTLSQTYCITEMLHHRLLTSQTSCITDILTDILLLMLLVPLPPCRRRCRRCCCVLLILLLLLLLLLLYWPAPFHQQVLTLALSLSTRALSLSLALSLPSLWWHGRLPSPPPFSHLTACG
jgi:hypothetical protein